MDLKSIQLFQHLAQSLHFGKTAEAMYVSPSTLSRAIQRLEDEVGVTLFQRDNRSAKLTPAGKRFVRFADMVQSEWSSLKSDIQTESEVMKGSLSVFCSVTASMSYLPKLLSAFQSDYPQVELKLMTGNPGEAATKVLEKIVDIAIAIHTPNFPKELHFQQFDTVPLVLVSPKSSIFDNIQEVDWRKESVILPDSGPSKRIVHHWFSEKGIRPNVYATVGSNEAILSMVALGCGIGFIPEIVVRHSTVKDKVNLLTMSDIESYQLGLCCLQKRVQEPIIDAFLSQKNLNLSYQL